MQAMPHLLAGAITTIWITAIAVSLGVLIGMVVGIARLSENVFSGD
jgi:ABC-type amino acid transport system permease subunit